MLAFDARAACTVYAATRRVKEDVSNILRLDVEVKLPCRSVKHNAIRETTPFYTYLCCSYMYLRQNSSLLCPQSSSSDALRETISAVYGRTGQPYADFEMRSASEYEFDTASGKAQTMSSEAYPLSEQGPFRRGFTISGASG